TTHDVPVASHTSQGTCCFDLNRDGSFGAADGSAPGATVTLRHTLFAYSRAATAASDGTYTISGLPDGSYRTTSGLNGRTLSASTETVAQADATQVIAVPHAAASGCSASDSGAAVRDRELPVRVGSADDPPGDVGRERAVLDPPPGRRMARQRTILRLDGLVRDARPGRRRHRQHHLVRPDVRPGHPGQRYGER